MSRMRTDVPRPSRFSCEGPHCSYEYLAGLVLVNTVAKGHKAGADVGLLQWWGCNTNARKARTKNFGPHPL